MWLSARMLKLEPLAMYGMRRTRIVQSREGYFTNEDVIEQ